jgi:hypothetical protein
VRLDTLFVSLDRPEMTQITAAQRTDDLKSLWGTGLKRINDRTPTESRETVKITMSARASVVRNDYRCSIERNQGGKYCIRVQVHYPRHAWTLGVFFLASSFDRAMKKLEESLDFLQRHEEKLWFWGVDRAADMGFSAEFLREAGMRLDRRVEFPRKATSVTLVPEREVPAFVLGPMRRGLAESVESPRSLVAGD